MGNKNATQTGESRKFLIVDDDKASRRILSLMLKEFGSSTDVGTGEEALEKMQEALGGTEVFDVLFLDNVLPGMQGLDVLRDIRGAEDAAQVPDDKRVPVIMLTGKADVETIDDAKLLGVSAYILKPVEEQKLLRELQRLRLIPDPDDQWA